MSLITFQCYACNQMLKVSADKGGKKTKCIKCGTILTIPVAASEPEVLAPEILAPEVLAPEVIEDVMRAPPPLKRSVRREDDFRDLDDDRPRKRRDSRDDAYEDDDRPQSRRRDEDDERPSRPARRDRYEDEDDDRPRRRRDEEDDYDRGGRGGRQDWSKVRIGMLIVFIALCVFVGVYAVEHIAVLILTIGSFSSGMGIGGGAGDAILVILRIAVSILPLTLIAVIVGQVFWCLTRNNHGAMGLGIAAAGVTGFAFIWMLIFKTVAIYGSAPSLPYGITILLNFSNFRGGLDLGHAILLGIVNVLVGVMFLMMGLYVRAQALTLRDRRTAGKGMAMIIFGSVAAGYQLLWPFLMRAFASVEGGGKGMLAVTWIIYWIGVGFNIFILIYFILAIRRAKQMVERAD